MNILMIFRNNPLETSGAVALNLFNELAGRGHRVGMLVNTYHPGYPQGVISMETKAAHWKTRILNKLYRMMGKKDHLVSDPKYHFHEADESRMFYSTNALLKKAGMKPDAVLVLFAKNFVNAKNIREIYERTKAPIYWMMYDTSPLTGGCHYSWDCNGYEKLCGSCPGLYSSNPNDITYKNMVLKQEHLSKTNIHLVIASKWQELQAAKSSLFRNKAVHKIFISINPKIFYPEPAGICRPPLGIPVNKKVIFFGAYFLGHERKGMNYLLDSLRILHKKLEGFPDISENVLLLIAGTETEKLKPVLPFSYLDLGMLNNSTGVAEAYRVSDLFVCPSIEDAGPSMVNQSIMSGTPVVAFDQGVAMDIVITGETGYRARLKDAEDLAEGMFRILTLSTDAHEEMKQHCRKLALDLLNPETCTQQWLAMLENNLP